MICSILFNYLLVKSVIMQLNYKLIILKTHFVHYI